VRAAWHELVQALLKRPAVKVTVVAPATSEAIMRWHAEGKLVWHQREFSPEDLTSQFMVYAATDNRELNALVYQLANCEQRVANAVDDLRAVKDKAASAVAESCMVSRRDMFMAGLLADIPEAGPSI
jgi:siroheme synthase (precorrin-2 oxidase/ferrochelatase)